MTKMQCRKCNSDRLVVYSRKMKFTYGVGLSMLSLLLISAGVMFYIYICLVFGLVSAMIGLAYLGMAAAHTRTKIRCKFCGTEWKLR